MYTVVMMAALGGSVDVPDCGRRGGCYGDCYGGCYGGYSYGGCYGNYYGGGCYGGYGYGSCYGGGYGCSGYAYGSGYGGGGYVMNNYSSPYGYAYSNYNSTYPSSQQYASNYYTPGAVPASWSTVNNNITNNNPPSMMPSSPQSEGSKMETNKAPAKVIVNLPADARLTIEGEPTHATSDERTFVTPPLQRGKTYHYTLKAEIDRKGETVKTSKDVEVRGGETSRVSLDFPVGNTEK